MKGIELPINILVIVAVAIIVLLGVIALFYSSWFTGTGPVTAQAAISGPCNQVTRSGSCTTTPLTIAINPAYKTYATMEAFCVGEYGYATADKGWPGECWKTACGMNC
jgi:hypothetical protein